MSELVKKNDFDFDFIEVDHSALRSQNNVEREESSRTVKTGGIPVKWMKIRDGEEFTIRFFPPFTREGEWANSPYIRTFKHWGVGPDGKKAVNCAEKMGAGECYICEQVKALFEQRDELVGKWTNLPDKIVGPVTREDGVVIPQKQAAQAKEFEKQARRLLAKKAYIYQVIDVDDPVYHAYDDEVKGGKVEDGTIKIQILSLSQSTHDKIIDFMADPTYGQVTHPLKGFNFVLSRRGSGLDTEYFPKIALVATEEGPQFVKTPMFGTPSSPDMEKIQAALQGMHNLAEHPFFRAATYDEGLAVWEGRDPRSVGGNTEKSENAEKGDDKGVVEQMRDATLEQWIDATSGGNPMTKEELAAWGGWDLADLAGVECYSKEPDHEDQGCWECQLRNACVACYAAENGKSSISQPDPVPSKKLGFGGKKKSDAVAAMQRELENAAK